MAYLTQTKIIKMMIDDAAPMSKAQIIADIIESDRKSDEKLKMQEGIDYFKGDHAILGHDFRTYTNDGIEKTDKNASNNQLVANFHQLLVEQKTAFVVGNPISFTVKKDVDRSEEYSEELNELLGDRFDDEANNWVKGTSNQGRDWLHPFINSKGEFDYCITPAIGIYPIYDSRRERELVQLIRYYQVEYTNSRGEKEYRYHVEWWTKKDVEFWKQDAKGNYVLDGDEAANPRGHFYEFERDNPKDRVYHSWGRVPFIELKNNDECQSDLEKIKSLIDDYNFQRSKSSNNLADIQEAIYVLMGLMGQNLTEFRDNLKTFRAIKVDGGPGDSIGVETLTMNIPVEATKTHVDQLREEIFMFGMGVDFSTDRFGSNPTGIALQFLYSNLDMKANNLIRKMKRALKEFVWFATTYLNMKNGSVYDPRQANERNEAYSPNDVETTFNKAMIFNESEHIENTQKSKGVVSDQTVLANHPWVDDPDEEMRKIEEEGSVSLLDDDEEDEEVKVEE